MIAKHLFIERAVENDRILRRTTRALDPPSEEFMRIFACTGSPRSGGRLVDSTALAGHRLWTGPQATVEQVNIANTTFDVLVREVKA